MKIDKQNFLSILQYSKNQQKKSLQVFKIFNNLCINNGIQFSLCEGTLLGCVRHKGFVPWDDDIDVYITKSNIIKLLQLNNGYELELNKNFSNNHYFFYTNSVNFKKIDLFTSGFKNDLYLQNTYKKSFFENIEVLIPTNYKIILDSLYCEWENICYINNHKIAKEKFHSYVGYNKTLVNKYYKLDIETALLWNNEYENTRSKQLHILPHTKNRRL
jgi:hypothetical protein